MFYKIKQIIEQYKQICRNPDLKLLDFNKIDDLYRLQKTDQNASKLIKKMESRANKIKSVESIDPISQLYETYSEAIVYLHIKDKFETTYQESRGSNNKATPDFKCAFDNHNSLDHSNFYLEIKTPSVKEFKKGTHKLKRKQQIMETELNNNAELDAAFRKAKQQSEDQFVIVSHMHSIPDPLSPNNQDELKYIWKIKRTIEICSDMIKSDQFIKGSLNFMLFNLARIEGSIGIDDDSLAPNVINPYIRRYPKIDSGFLWHVVFGRKGYPIWGGTYDSPLEGHLDVDGILVQYPTYAGIIFLTKNGSFYGFYNSGYEHGSFNSNYSKFILAKITDGKINNNSNNYGYKCIIEMVKKIKLSK